MVHPDAEMPFLHPAPRHIEPRLIVGRLGHGPRQKARQLSDRRPGREKRPPDHHVENIGIARQILGKCRGGAANIHHKARQLGIGIEEREKLHTRRQAREEGVELAQRLVGLGCVLEALDHLRQDALEDLGRAGGAQGRIVLPPLGNLAPEIISTARRCRGRKEPFG